MRFLRILIGAAGMNPGFFSPVGYGGRYALLGHKTILLADDEESLRILVRVTLEDLGYEILEASDGDEALALALRRQPDLMVLDWMMPGKTGLEVTAEFRRQGPSRDTPVILLTARSQRDDIAAALGVGVTAYLVKPFSPIDLLDKAQEFLKA